MKIASLFLTVLLAIPSLGDEGWFGETDHGHEIWFSVARDRKLDDVVAGLKTEFPEVKFRTETPKLGFFAFGSSDRLGEIAQKLGQHLPKVTAYLPVRKGLDPENVLGTLKTRFPNVRIELAPPEKLVWLEGSPGAIDEVRELLSEG